MKMEERSIKEILGWLDSDNITDEFTDHELTEIGQQVKKDYEVAATSMTDWTSLIEIGLKLTNPATEGRSEPWDGASNFKSPALQEAAYRFGERASKELLRSKDLVKAEVVGNDPDGAKGDRAERVSKYQSFQLNHEMGDWRDEERGLLYRLPNMGTIFKKTFFDSMEQRIVSDIIQHPNFAVHQSTTSMNELRDFTHIIPLTKNDVISYQRAEIWRDIELSLGDGDSNADSTVEHHDPDHTFLEQQCFVDLDGDGYEEPYTVTIHKESATVVRIIPRYSAKDMTVIGDNRTYNVSDIYGPLSDEFGPVEDKDGEQKIGFGFPAPNPDPDQPDVLTPTSTSFEIVKITPMHNLTARRFLPSSDGSFLGVGYYQVMSSLVQAVNAGSNQLFNAGSLANLPAGFLANGMRKGLGDMRFKPGEWKSTNVDAVELQSGIYPLPVKEPSQTLFALVEKLDAMIKQLGASADLGEVIGTNTAASTVLMMIEESQTSTTSLMSEQARGQGKEFQIIFGLNAIYGEPEHYQLVLDEEEANMKADFAETDLDLFPTANPEIANQTQRIQQMQLLIEQYELLKENGADGYEIVRQYLEGMGFDDVEKILPPPSEEFQAQQTATSKAQETESQSLTRLQDAQSEALIANAENSRAKAKAEIEELPEKVAKLRADIMLTLEKADTEEAKNQIDTYAAQFDELHQSIDAIGKLDAIELNRNAPPAVGQGAPGYQAVSAPVAAPG